MLDHVTPLDAGALFAFVSIWMIYGLLIDGRFRRPRSINAQMIAIRRAWMTRLLERENRIGDATLVGHSIRSATFFASTTLILLAGLIGLLGSAEKLQAATANLSMTFQSGTLVLLELKIGLLIGIFVYAFFKFTWAIRQFNYFAAIIGSAPEPGSPLADDAFASRMALMLSHAFWQFNAGVRAYYFALAALGWFIHPVLLIVGAVLITFILVRRQLTSPTAHDIAIHAASLATGPVRTNVPKPDREA